MTRELPRMKRRIKRQMRMRKGMTKLMCLPSGIFFWRDQPSMTIWPMTTTTLQATTESPAPLRALGLSGKRLMMTDRPTKPALQNTQDRLEIMEGPTSFLRKYLSRQKKSASAPTCEPIMPSHQLPCENCSGVVVDMMWKSRQGMQMLMAK